MRAVLAHPLQAQRVASKIAAGVARIGRVDVVAGVVVAADADVVGARSRRDPDQGGVLARAEVRRLRLQHHTLGIVDAQVRIQAAGVDHVQPQRIACAQLHPVQVNIQRCGDGTADAQPLIDPQRRVERRGDDVAHVGRRAQRAQRCGVRPGAQAARAPSRAHRDDPCPHAGGHRQRDQLLVGAGGVAVHHRLPAEAAHRAPVDADDQVVGGQPRAFEHDGVARGHRAAHRLERGHDLQLKTRPTAQHRDRPRPGQRRHHHAERAAVPAARARERARPARVVKPQELHQRAVAHALARQRDGLARHRRRLAGIERCALAGCGADAGEHRDGLRAEVVARDLVPATVGGHPDRAVQAARGHHAQLVVGRAADVDRVVVGDPVLLHHPAHGDGGRTLHEARAVQIEIPVVLARPAVAHVHQLGHHLQPDARARVERLHPVLRVVGQRLVEHRAGVDHHPEVVRACADVQTLPAVDGVEVELQRVGLPGSQPAQAQRLAVVAKPAREAGEGGVGVVGGRAAPVGLGAGLEVVLEDPHIAAPHHHVVQAPALVVQVLQPTVGEADHRAVGPGGEVHRHLAVDRVHPGPAKVGEAQVLRPAVDHADIARAGQVGHAHLQPRAVRACQQRADGHHLGRAIGIARVEHHRGAAAEVGAAQLDHIAHVGRGLSAVGRRAVARQREHLRERGHRGGGPVQLGVDLVDLTLGAGHQQLAVAIKHQPADLPLVDQLAGQVHRAHQRAVAPHLVHQGTGVAATQPQIARHRVDGQARMGLDVHPRRQRKGGQQVTGDRVHLAQVVARL